MPSATATATSERVLLPTKDDASFMSFENPKRLSTGGVSVKMYYDDNKAAPCKVYIQTPRFGRVFLDEYENGKNKMSFSLRGHDNPLSTVRWAEPAFPRCS